MSENKNWFGQVRLVARRVKESMNPAQRAAHRLAGALAPGSKEWGSPRRTWRTFEEASLSGKESSVTPSHSLQFFDTGIAAIRRTAFARDMAQRLGIPYESFAAHREYVAVLRAGRIFFHGPCPIVIDADDAAIVEASHWMGNREIDQEGSYAHLRVRLPRPTRLTGRVLFLPRGGSNYYHFLIDTLCQMRLAERAGFAMNSIDYFVIPDPFLPFAREVFTQKLGLPLEKLIVGTDRHIEADELIIPTVFDRAGSWYAAYLKEFFALPLIKPNRRLFISRRAASSRRIVNEEEIFALIAQKYGFELVAAENLTVEKQMQLFSEAEIVVAPHGAGMTNILFCAPGTAVIELRAQEHYNETSECYKVLAEDCELRYDCLLGDSRPIPGVTTTEFADVYFDPIALTNLLAALLGDNERDSAHVSTASSEEPVQTV